jgi:hypothetical protein
VALGGAVTVAVGVLAVSVASGELVAVLVLSTIGVQVAVGPVWATAVGSWDGMTRT